jgi:hypothetical protein
MRIHSLHRIRDRNRSSNSSTHVACVCACCCCWLGGPKRVPFLGTSGRTWDMKKIVGLRNYFTITCRPMADPPRKAQFGTTMLVLVRNRKKLVNGESAVDWLKISFGRTTFTSNGGSVVTSSLTSVAIFLNQLHLIVVRRSSSVRHSNLSGTFWK